MLWMSVGILIILLIIILIVNSRLYVTCKYTYLSKEHFLLLKVHLYKFRLYKKEIHVKEKEEDMWEKITELIISESIDDFKKEIKALKKSSMKPILLNLLANVYFHNLKWKTFIGGEDASATGILAGGIWTVKGILVGLLYEWGQFKKEPIIFVEPNFQQKIIQSEINCIVSIKLGQAIYAAFKVSQKKPLKKEAFI